jgi:hypothetical protein
MFLCAQGDVVPLKFHKYSGVIDHKFRIHSKRYLGSVDHQAGYLIEIEIDGNWQALSLPFDRYPNQIEALAILTELDGESERQGRYINVHIAYEAVVKDRDVTFSSIRHALAHPITKLTRPDVRQSLINRFGGLDIDLKNYQHQKEIYRCIGQMLIQIEKSIYEEVTSHLVVVSDQE